MNLPGLISLLFAGESLNGCQLVDSDAVALANLHFPSRPYCLVSDWAILDIDVTPPQLQKIAYIGLTPALINALTVIEDSKGRFRPGDWVRSTLAVSFTHGCLFETKNTIYVLMGPGGRLRTDLDTALSMC
ncbi:DUF6957 family protein [Pseudomonas triticicola]|uniref:DUF6957 family protein n=1 Tax=Pseudomonas triticicola TaxID=2842345 RepID=UPI003EB9430F